MRGVKARRVFGLFVFAFACIALGFEVARWGGWSPEPRMQLPPDLPRGPGTGPFIYIDAGAIELHDGSLVLDPPEPPRIPVD